MAEPKIPVENLFFLLCYAWDYLDQADVRPVSAEGHTSLVDLLARVLCQGVRYLFKRGVYQRYLSNHDDGRVFRGKLDSAQTMHKNLLAQARVACEFEHLSPDIQLNQIIKATLRHLLVTENLDHSLVPEIRFLLRTFSDISDVELSPDVFGRITIHRMNRFYGFLASVCEVIYHGLLPSETEGSYRFRSFVRDEAQMAGVFENFVRNFYRIEQKDFRVKREDIRWNAVASDPSNVDLLQKMQTDTSLINDKRHIVIETKYYAETLSGRYDRKGIHNAHLYQLMAYLRNLPIAAGIPRPEGILLCPTVDDELDAPMVLEGYPVRVRTLNLNRPWQRISEDMLNLICVTAPDSGKRPTTR